MPEIPLPAIRLYYKEHGTGAPILLIHGMGSDADSWGPASEELARLGRVIVYDRRGCTRSERPEPYHRTTPADQADDSAALQDGLGALPAIVIGHSYGVVASVVPRGRSASTRRPNRARRRAVRPGFAAPASSPVRRWPVCSSVAESNVAKNARRESSPTEAS